jgi:hypothetical protein
MFPRVKSKREYVLNRRCFVAGLCLWLPRVGRRWLRVVGSFKLRGWEVAEEAAQSGVTVPDGHVSLWRTDVVYRL